jgi:hypothetical protein
MIFYSNVFDILMNPAYLFIVSVICSIIIEYTRAQANENKPIMPKCTNYVKTGSKTKPAMRKSYDDENP